MDKCGRDSITVIIPFSYIGSQNRNAIYKKSFSNNLNIIEYNLSLLIKSRFKNIHIVCETEPKKRKNNINYIVNENVKNYNDTYSICLAFNEIKNKNVLIINPFTFFDKTIFKKFTFKSTETIYSENENSSKKNIGLTTNNDSGLHNLMWGIPNVWSQMLFICESDFNTFYKIICLMKSYKLYFFEIINKLSESIKIDSHKTLTPIIQIEENTQLLQAKRLLNEN